MSRTELKRKRNKAILNSAEEAIVNNGLFSLSLLELARQSGCPVNTLYNYFSSREDIAVALFNRIIGKWGVKASQEIALLPGSFAERFVAMQLIWVYRARLAMDPGGVQFLAAMPCVWKHASHQRIATTRKLLDRWYQLNCDFLVCARERGELGADDQTIHHCLNLVTCLERGFSLFSNNYSFRDEMMQMPIERVYQSMLPILEPLKWTTPLEEMDEERVLALCEQVHEELERFDVDEMVERVEASLEEG
ncbi:TetR/AcrR family transcriptional regulator [Ferrimonas sediminicola]|uniref:TetR/AcrR family transcriptional regulator n=1 Tax=Ferrimonas sediminicola TaxID=2569538 RepID=A0A4U1BGQ8_9GAMM|nr:TetR/AcrR family transcriptional regulator [Ferrimonas sediminicola]TKB49221.1 TetR/AcrR family transcriptional regulator [Ferrimonas sediminicola]